MSEENVDLETNWRGEPSGRSRSWAGIIVLSLLLLLALGGCGVLGWLWSQENARVIAQKDELQILNAEVVGLQGKVSDLSGQLQDQQAESVRLKREWDTQVAQLKSDHQDQMQRTYAQMDNIVHDSRKTLEYINRIERKLREGQELSREEAQELAAIGNGLTFLHRQYEKPIEEFRELEKFLTKQLNVASVVPPTQRGAFFKRMFSKDYREHEQEYFRDQGKRAAFERSRAKVTEAYARAQAQMRQLSVQSEEYLKNLQAIVSSNQSNAAETADFFEQSKEILQIHDRIMSLEPDEPVQVRP